MAEAHYYEIRCEDCERAAQERLTAWRKGEAREPELDKFYLSPSLSTKGGGDE